MGKGDFEEVIKRLVEEKESLKKKKLQQTGALNDEFDELFGEVIEEMGSRQDGEVEEFVEPVEESVASPPTAPPVVEDSAPLQKLRRTASTTHLAAKLAKRDTRTQHGRDAMGLSEFEVYACDMPSCEEWLNKRMRMKPLRVVTALVILRDKYCWCCGDVVQTLSWKVRQVVQLKPNSRGGEYSELNCKLVCAECAKCWNKDKDFYPFGINKNGVERQKLYVLTRRRREYKGSRHLSESGSTIMYDLYKRKDELESAYKMSVLKMGNFIGGTGSSLNELVSGWTGDSK